MAFIDSVTNLLTGGVAGGIFGLVGSYLQSRNQRLMKEMEFQHEKTMQEMAQEAMKLEHDQALKLSEIDLDKEAKILAAKDLISSRQTDEPKGYSTWVDDLRGSVRPVLTYFTLIIFSVALLKTIFGWGTFEEGTLLYEYSGLIIQTYAFSVNLVLTWWFGTRDNAKIFGLGADPRGGTS